MSILHISFVISVDTNNTYVVACIFKYAVWVVSWHCTGAPIVATNTTEVLKYLKPSYLARKK